MEKLLVLLGIFLQFFWLISPNSAQRLPDIACPQYFKYLLYNQQFIGHISVRHDPRYDMNELVVEFSQRGAYQWSHSGSLSLLDNQETIKSNIRDGNPINYRVDFPIPSIPPKLTQIRLNNVVLCSSTQNSPPKTAIILKHSVHSTTVPVSFLDAGGVNPHIIEETQGPHLTTPRPRPAFQPQTIFGNRVQLMSVHPTPVLPVLPEQPLSAVCGRERAVTTPLIFQGEQLQRGQLPWLVGLLEKKTDNGLTFFCGGTLLSSWTVLSAAHCFRFPGRDLPANRSVVSLGRNTIDIFLEGVVSEVSQLLYHEEYDASAKADLVLIRLAQQITYNDYIVPICLWTENFPLQLPSGYKAYVAGWGADENGNANTKFSKITDTNIVTESNCLRELRQTGLVHSDSICARRVGTGPCASDGGGGLMLRENNVWLLRGVISLGLIKNNTCDLSKPSLFVDVAKHISWLRQNIWQ